MKRCPQCNRTYTDDALSFCLDDGSPLVSASAPSSFDPSATIQYPQSRETTPQPTIAYGPGQPPPSMPPPSTPPPPQWSPMPPMTPQKRSVWPWILGIGAVLAFMGIGVVILIIVLASMGANNNNNSNTNSNVNSNRANRNSNALEHECQHAFDVGFLHGRFLERDLVHGLVNSTAAPGTKMTSTTSRRAPTVTS